MSLAQRHASSAQTQMSSGPLFYTDVIKLNMSLMTRSSIGSNHELQIRPPRTQNSLMELFRKVPEGVIADNVPLNFS